MKAKVTVEFRGRRDGAPQVETIGVGEIISGDLANVAVAEKWAEEIDEGTEKRRDAKKAKAAQSVGDAEVAVADAKAALAAAAADKKTAAEAAVAAAEKALADARTALAKFD